MSFVVIYLSIGLSLVATALSLRSTRDKWLEESQKPRGNFIAVAVAVLMVILWPIAVAYIAYLVIKKRCTA